MAKPVLVVIIPAHSGDLRAAGLSGAAVARERGGIVRMMYVRPVPSARVDRYDRIVAGVDQEMARLSGAAEEEMAAVRWDLGGVEVERVVRFGRLGAEVAIEAQEWAADLNRAGRADPSGSPSPAARLVSRPDRVGPRGAAAAHHERLGRPRRQPGRAARRSLIR